MALLWDPPAGVSCPLPRSACGNGQLPPAGRHNFQEMSLSGPSKRPSLQERKGAPGGGAGGPFPAARVHSAEPLAALAAAEWPWAADQTGSTVFCASACPLRCHPGRTQHHCASHRRRRPRPRQGRPPPPLPALPPRPPETEPLPLSWLRTPGSPAAPSLVPNKRASFPRTGLNKARSNQPQHRGPSHCLHPHPLAALRPSRLPADVLMSLGGQQRLAQALEALPPPGTPEGARGSRHCSRLGTAQWREDPLSAALPFK